MWLSRHLLSVEDVSFRIIKPVFLNLAASASHLIDSDSCSIGPIASVYMAPIHGRFRHRRRPQQCSVIIG